MRHNKKFNHLSRTASHRKAMLSNMATSLIMHKRINTTVAKAKALRKYIEPLINKSKLDTTHSRRVVFSYLQNKYAVTELFSIISEKVATRPGGYTRVIKTGFRRNDNAPMCFIELVDFDENMAKTEKKTKRTRRSRRSSASEQAAPAAAEQTAEAAEPVAPVEEAPVAEEPAEAPEAAVEEAPAVEAEPVAEEAPAEEEESKQ